MLSHFRRVRLFETPRTMAHQALPSMGFSRQGYWSGLPFPSPVIRYVASEGSEVKSISCVWLFAPHGLQPTRLLRPWDFPSKSTGVGCHFLLQNFKVEHVKYKSFVRSKQRTWWEHMLNVPNSICVKKEENWGKASWNIKHLSWILTSRSFK